MNDIVHRRALFVSLVLVAGFSVLSGRLIYLQWMSPDGAEQKSAVKLEQKDILPGWFGNIVDRNEDLMARSRSVTRIAADKGYLRDLNVAARGVAFSELMDTKEWIEGTEDERRVLLKRRSRQLREEVSEAVLLDSYIEFLIPIAARALGIGTQELEERLEGSLDYIVLAKDVDEEEAAEIEATLKENRIYGFRFERDVKRWYVTSHLATHTTGYVDHEGVGRCGLERELGEYLRGRDGHRITGKDRTGMNLLAGSGTLMKPQPGFDAKLAVDLGLQAIAEEELDWGLQEFGSERGAVIMIDPKTGDVLAIVSRPHFDLNDREEIKGKEVHYAVQAIYEPGSTLKIVATTAALDLGLMAPHHRVFCENGYYAIPNGYVKDYKAFGYLSLEQVLGKSSNIGAYKIGARVNSRRFMKYLKAFGFHEKTGILLSGEQRGLITDHTNLINFSRLTYGYSIAVTPLQIAYAYAAIANDGVRMKPRLVHSLIANDGRVAKEFEPEEATRVMSVSTARKMRKALATVVSPKGTARRAMVPGYVICGKTGTAKKLSEAGRYLEGVYTVSFAGIFPAEDPAFVCVVVVDDPKTKKVTVGGGSVAAPIFQRIAARAAKHLKIQPTEPIEEKGPLASHTP